MNFPCVQRNCTDSLIHFSPRKFRWAENDSPLWAHVVQTCLPYHTQYKRITFPSEDDDWLMCTAVLMDEERIVLSTCLSVSIQL
jgi:hypothetical protein